MKLIPLHELYIWQPVPLLIKLLSLAILIIILGPEAPPWSPTAKTIARKKMAITYQQATDQLHAWTKTESLLKHARAVEVVMRAAAGKYGGADVQGTVAFFAAEEIKPNDRTEIAAKNGTVPLRWRKSGRSPA